MDKKQATNFCIQCYYYFWSSSKTMNKKNASSVVVRLSEKVVFARANSCRQVQIAKVLPQIHPSFEIV